MAFVPIAMAVSAAVSALAAASAGVQASNAQNYNAQVADQQAKQEQEVGQSQAQIVDQQNREKLGQMSAAFGAAGVDASGTPLSVMSDAAKKGELNRQLTLYGGQARANAATNQATIDRFEGNAALTGGIMKAGSTLLTAAYKTSQASSAGTPLTASGGAGP